ncbi:hypothetical protein VFPPC_17961 [Pochonia chlamydosporia 170]|uniref:Uncharacterized protein n=1 Tax=Pochonia chlamydosporia 170 TaxID=1380566 RepID=A0A219APV8_METCM|nr:hypothetical protein VFPPC_17961 [Pochonia chlamydosporia 170]OWT42846.1 hypothetical protein VFPPC_17961 [Pochonia chlamydosporia 170]
MCHKCSFCIAVRQQFGEQTQNRCSAYSAAVQNPGGWFSSHSSTVTLHICHPAVHLTIPNAPILSLGFNCQA